MSRHVPSHAILMQSEVDDGKGGRHCPIPDELKKYPVWAGCGEWAYAAHPKGFRSSFGFNTNIWLSKKFERVWEALLVPAGKTASAASSGSKATMSAEEMREARCGIDRCPCFAEDKEPLFTL